MDAGGRARAAAEDVLTRRRLNSHSDSLLLH